MWRHCVSRYAMFPNSHIGLFDMKLRVRSAYLERSRIIDNVAQRFEFVAQHFLKMRNVIVVERRPSPLRLIIALQVSVNPWILIHAGLDRHV